MNKLSFIRNNDDNKIFRIFKIYFNSRFFFGGIFIREKGIWMKVFYYCWLDFGF